MDWDYHRGIAKFDGTHWEIYNSKNSKLQSDNIRSMTLAPNGDLWVGTWGYGLSEFDGQNFTNYNTSNSGLPGNHIFAIAIDSLDNKWIATSEGLSVYSGNGETVIDGVEEKDELKPSGYSLKQNYPNPFNPSTKIEFSLKNADHVMLKVYDIMGKEVATLVNESMAAGNHKVNFSAPHLPSGVYIYRIQAGEYKEMHKMLLLK